MVCPGVFLIRMLSLICLLLNASTHKIPGWTKFAKLFQSVMAIESECPSVQWLQPFLWHRRLSGRNVSSLFFRSRTSIAGVPAEFGIARCDLALLTKAE